MGKRNKVDNEAQKSHITVSMPMELKKEFKAKVAKEGKTSKEVINSLIKEYVREK